MSREKYLLRDLKSNTELLLLSEFMRNPSVKRKDVAQRLGITEQAISQYISGLESRGLIKETNGLPRPTRKGVQLLQERLTELNEEIRDILRQIRVIDSCVALAGSRIKANQKVGLVMRNGRLIALPSVRAASTGTAMADANKDEEVLVGSLQGVVEMNLGELLILQAPSASSGGSRKIDRRVVGGMIGEFKCDQVVAGDITGEVVSRKVGITPTIIHAPVQSALSALSKGLNVLFIGTRESVDDMLESVEELKKRTGYSIKFRIVDIRKAD